jgi:hypothetical protein
MTRPLLLLFSLATAPIALNAQTVVRPAGPLAAAHVPVRDAMLVLRDSLMTVNGAAARLQRDFRQTSDAALTWRAREIANACARSVRTVVPTRKALAAADARDRARMNTRAAVLRALDSLSVEMTRCSNEFGAMALPGKGEEVRGYGNRRAEPILKALYDYDATATRFFKAWGMDVRPLGARPDPLAS